MRTLITSLLALAFAATARAEPRTEARVLKDTTTQVSIPLNAETVFCTERGYGIVQLKVSVPDLAWLAHFDHRVVGEGLPCITGGACSDTQNPGEIIDAAHPLETIPVRVVLSEQLTIDDEAKTCTRFLTEAVTSLIRRHKFEHYRYSDEAVAVPYEQCLAVLGL